MKRLSLAIVGLTALAGCEEETTHSISQGAHPSASDSVIAAKATVSAAAERVATIPSTEKATTSAEPESPKPNAGPTHWTGTYTAKRAFLTTEAGVANPDRRADRGESALGTGKVALHIAETGEVSGRIDGPLGSSALRGTRDEDLVVATSDAMEPASGGVTYGTVWLSRVGEILKGELRAASSDGRLVRVVEVELQAARAGTE